MPANMMPAARRIKRNDPSLTHLLMCEPPTRVRGEGPHFDTAYMTGDKSAKALCNGIGKNTHLQDVGFDGAHGLTDVTTTVDTFKGLRGNTSIRSLGFTRCELSVGVGRGVLRAFEANGKHLTKFTLWRCSVRHGGVTGLSSTLSRCMHLREVTLSLCLIDDAVVQSLVSAIRGHHELERLDLPNNIIGAAGCEALATLLQGPNCSSLQSLDLSNNLVDRAGANAIANGLKNNRKLNALFLEENSIDSKGWNAISDVLCDTSSLDSTYSSNHTLCMIASYGRVDYDDDEVIPRNLLSLINLNGRYHDKNLVARKKILQHHFNDGFHVGPFVMGEMELSFLPHVLSWIGRSSDNMTLSAMFNLFQQLPTWCVVPSFPASSCAEAVPCLTAGFSFVRCHIARSAAEVAPCDATGFDGVRKKSVQRACASTGGNVAAGDRNKRPSLSLLKSRRLSGAVRRLKESKPIFGKKHSK